MFGLPAEVGETKEIERLRLPQTLGHSPSGSMLPELDQPGLVWMQLQPELREPFAEVRQEPLRVFLVLETDGEVVGESHDDDVTVREPLPPPLSP